MKISGHTSSLRVRFILAIGIALISWYDLYNPECKKEPVGGFKQKCQSIAFLLTKTVTDSLLYKDILKIDSIVSDAIKDDDILYIFVYDEKGNLLNTLHAGLDLEDHEIKKIVGSEGKGLSETVTFATNEVLKRLKFFLTSQYFFYYFIIMKNLLLIIEFLIIATLFSCGGGEEYKEEGIPSQISSQDCLKCHGSDIVDTHYDDTSTAQIEGYVHYPYAAQLLYDSLMGLGVTPSIPRPSRNDRSAIIYQ
jgi:hypothetical protein